MFGFFNKKNKEYISINTEKLKEYLYENGIVDDNKVDKIIEEFKNSIENKVKEKTELTYDEFIAEIESITGKMYTNPSNRIELCRQIDEFIENNPEIANSIKLYASYITFGSINVKLDDYIVNIIADDEKTLQRARNIIDRFEKYSKIKRLMYIIAKDLVSYGDAFLEKIYDTATGRLLSVAYIPSNKVLILIDDYGNIKKIYQVLDENIRLTDMNESVLNDFLDEKKIIEYNKNEIIHFSDGTLPGFSDSPLRNLLSVWKSYKLIEEALIIHRITRSRRILVFFLDVTGKEPQKVQSILQKFVRKLTNAFSINISESMITSRKSVIKQGSDIVIPITKDSATKVQSIPADTSATKIDDLKFYHTRVLQNLLTGHIFGDTTIQKEKMDYIDKALLRLIRTYQRYMSYALEDLYSELLSSYEINNVTINVQFPSPDTDEEVKIVDTLIRRIMVINQLIATIGIVPPFDWIIHYVFKDLTQAEIQELVALLKQEKAKQEQSNKEFMSILDDNENNNSQEQFIKNANLNLMDLISDTNIEDNKVIEQYRKINTYDEKLKYLTTINNLLDLGLRYLEQKHK